MEIGIGSGIGMQWVASGGGAVVPLRISATRARAYDSNAGANRYSNSRTFHVATDAITRLKIAYANFRLTSGASGELAQGSVLTLTASVEYPAGTFTQITFDSGSASKAVADGAIAFSDYCNISIPDGATFYIRMFRVTTAGGMAYCNWRNSAGGDLLNVSASLLTDLTLGGTISSSGNFSAPPFAIMSETNRKSLLLIGDSKTHGFGDTAESASAAGPGLRGELAKSLPSTFPFVNMATGGARANLWPTEWVKRAEMLPYASHYFLNLGHNDIYVSAATSATTKTNIEVITAAILAANPTAKIAVATQTHKSTSTDSFATTLNQTATGVSDKLLERTALNVAIRSSLVAGQNDGFIEIADQVENARNTGIWKVDGTAFKYTSDGIHETAAGYDLITASGAVPTPT